MIFSIAMGAEYLSYVKSIETQARTFLPLNISAVGSVSNTLFIRYQNGSKLQFFIHNFFKKIKILMETINGEHWNTL